MSGNGQIAGCYRIDPKQSRFSVEVEAGGLLSVFGHNPVIAVCGFGGDARFNPDQQDANSLFILVRADSLAVVGDVSEKDRLEMERAIRGEVLETAYYPEAVFMSSSVSANPTANDQYHARIRGSLSLHGATRDHTIDAQLSLNGSSLRAQGEFTLRQTDYNIKLVSVAGGTLKVKDEVRLSFDIFAGK